VKQKIRYFI